MTYTPFTATSRWLPVKWRHFRSLPLTWGHVTATSCELEPSKSSNVPKTWLIGLLQPLKVTSGLMTSVTNHFQSLPVTLSTSDATTLVIQWQPPLDLHRNGIIRRYIVNITELDTSTLLQYFTTDLNITVPSLHPFYQYGYTVSAETIGVGPFSDTSIIHMPEAGRYMWCAYSND